MKELINDFYKKYGNPDNKAKLFFSPGRVNLIGEHTDYQGGYVFPCALDFGTYMAVRLTNDDTLKMASKNFDYTATIPLSEAKEKKGDNWVNYPLGVMNEFMKKGIELKGMEMLYYGDIPNGSGLSSSASIEVVTAYALNTLLESGFDKIDLVKMSQAAENLFVGVNCGIMDQFASAMGLKEHAVLLNCDTLDYEKVPIHTGDYQLVIANTNKKRGLAGSKYNERWNECQEAVKQLSQKEPISQLADINLDKFETIKDVIDSEVVKRRAQHVISENERVLKAVEALKNDELETFGILMNQSHDSLRDDYEVTGIELDTLVDEARKIEGVLGARMTGAGFGGCTVNLVKKSQVNAFIAEVGKSYKNKTNIQPDFYVANIGDGVKEIVLSKMPEANF